jgi:hypothetical protein
MIKCLNTLLQKWDVTGLPPLQESRPEILGEKRGKGNTAFTIQRVFWSTPTVLGNTLLCLACDAPSTVDRKVTVDDEDMTGLTGDQ